MNINSFIQSRRSRWARLESILNETDRKGLPSCRRTEVEEMFRLYRLTSSDLTFAQTHTANPAILDYLETLVGRSYAILAIQERTRPWSAWWRIMRHGLPETVRRRKTELTLAAALMICGILFGWITTAIDPDLTRIYLPAEHLSQTPSERVAELEQLEKNGNAQVAGISGYGFFSSYLFTHNIRVSILAFALGLTFGLGTSIILFYNGVILGSIAEAYRADGVMTFFIAWVGPHGSIELPCIVLAGTAGLLIGRTQWRHRGPSTWTALANERTDLLRLLVGAASLLVIAGLIEGGFSQINEPTIPYPLKIMVALILFGLLLGYLFWMPIRTSGDSSLRGTG